MFDSERYPALRIFIMLLRILAAIPTLLGVFALLAGGVEQFQQKSGGNLLIAIVISLGPLIIGLLLFASSEVLRVLIDIEGNTRRTSEELDLLPLTLRKAERE